ncbi:MAG: hypothetical protein JXA38_05010 [Methanosarcinaceae archaeon]|nr:hypothetical protein [Methanosarcinaceae archaeon]
MLKICKFRICPNKSSCGLVMDRDYHATINILIFGLQSIGIKSVETHEF